MEGGCPEPLLDGVLEGAVEWGEPDTGFEVFPVLDGVGFLSGLDMS
jgi:hypothetical protein